jgi:hypothetical protein
LELLELSDEARVGLDARPFSGDEDEAVLKGSLVLVHEVGDEQGSGAGDARSTVDQHVTLLPLLFYEPKDREEGVTHLLVLTVPQVQLMNRHRSLEVDVEIHRAHNSRNPVFPERCLILGEMHPAEPHLPQASLSIQDLLSLIEKSWHFRLGHFTSPLFYQINYKSKNAVEYLLI